MRCLFRLDPSLGSVGATCAPTAAAVVSIVTPFGSSLAGLLCANEEEANLAGQQPHRDHQGFGSIRLFMATTRFPITDRELWFQHGSERQSKEARPRKVLAIFGAGARTGAGRRDGHVGSRPQRKGDTGI
jgi:hypothetical protein